MLKDISGKEIKLSNYIGNKLIIVFWSPECSHCVNMLDGLKRVYKNYGKKIKLISVLMIPVDDKVKNKLKVLKIPFAVYRRNERGGWNGFIEREIDRDVIKSIINKYYKKSGMSYKKMLNKINIEEKDYHKFMSLLHKYKLLNKS